MNYNSIIKPIQGTCVDCVKNNDSNIKYLIAGRCNFHYRIYRNSANKTTKHKRQQSLEGALVASYGLAEFFKKAMYYVSQNPFCIECDAEINPIYYRHAVAHIFPKKTFISIATHPKNFLVLNAPCGCHHKTHTLETFSKMKCWPIAVAHFYEFENEITESNKYLHQFKKLACQSQLLIG